MRMNRWMETLLAAMMALGPTIIAVTMMQHYGPLGIACSLIFSGIYMLVLVLALTLRSCLRQRNSQSDQEQLQNAEEDDSPPSYEVVTSKPPPYSLLFANAPPTCDVTSCPIPAAGPAGYVAPVHNLPHDHSHQHKGVFHCYTWIMMNPEASPPSYFEAVSNNSPHPSEAMSSSSFSSGDTSPSTSSIGATPPSPLHVVNTPPSLLYPGTTSSTPPLSSTAHICSDLPACTRNSRPSDTKHFPT